MSKVYKIREKTSGLFSKGGACYVTGDVEFTKNGKVWTSLSALSQHLTAACSDGIIHVNGKIVGFDLSKLDQYHPYRNCEIMEADIVFDPVKDVVDFVTKKANFGCKAEEALKK